MKNSIYFLCLFLLLNISIYPQADWKPVGSPTGGSINAIIEKDGYLFLGTGVYWSTGAVYRSDDNGKTWQLKINNLPANHLVYDMHSNDTYIFTASISGKVYRSSDYGESWESASNGISYLTYSVFADGNTIYAGTVDGVFKSTNNGNNWINFSSGLASDLSIHSFFKVEDYLFAGTSNGVYRSLNGGNWEAVNNGINQLYPYTYSFIYKDGYLFAGTHNNVYRSTNMGNSWIKISTIQDGAYEFKISDDKIYKSNYYGLHYTTDYGQTWVTFNNPAVFNKYLEDFYISNGLILAGETELSRSEDNGNTWLFSSAGIANISTGGFAEKDGIMYTYSMDKIYHSFDNGLTWQLAATLPEYTTVRSLFVYNDYIFAGNFHLGFRSADGVNWEPLNKSISHFLAYNDYLFGIQNNSYIGKILRSSDSGTTWEELDIPVIINVSSIVSYRGELYIGGFEGLFKSNDNGESWQQVEYTTTVNSSVQQLYVHNNYLLLKDNSASGFYRTENGVDWNYISSTNLSFSSLFKSYGNILFAAAGYNGVMVSYDNGENWTSFNQGLPTNNNGYVLNIDGLHIKDNTLFASVANFSIWSTPLVAVPVELTSFTAKYSGSTVYLNWQTGSEINNKGFEIERLNNNSNLQVWEKVGFVNGMGTSTENQSYSFVDKNLKSGKYSYRLKQIDFDGTFEFSNIVEVDVEIPNEFALEQNYPNPFNPSTKIKYHIPVESRVSLKIYNVLGKEILSLVNDVKQPGVYEVEFQNKGGLSSGVYFYTLEAGSFSDTKKFLMLK